MTLVSKDILTIYIVSFKHFVSSKHTGRIVCALGVYAFASLLSGAGIVSFLAGFGSMALGLGLVSLTNGYFSDMWQSFWSKLLY